MSYPDHGKYEWLPILYDFVKVLEPKKIVEFGPGRGVTTIIMAQALRDNNIEGHINSYDIWDNEYWGGHKLSQSEYKVWEVSDYITLTQLDFYDWIKTDEDFDFLYEDVIEYCEGKEIFVQDLFGGADPSHRLSTRIYTEYAWHSLFIQNLLIEVEDVDKMTVTTKRVVTVLNKYGDRYVHAYDFYDDGDAKIKSQSAYVYDKMGNEIKKYKQRDFKDQSAVGSSNLYSDNRVSYLDYSPMSYPYTVVYESEVQMSTTVFIQPFQPVDGYFVSMESGSYQLKNPKHIPLRYLESNLDSIKLEKNTKTYVLKIKLEKLNSKR